MVKKNTLLLIAFILWSITEFNILIIGMVSYREHITIINFILSVVVFLISHYFLFRSIVKKHIERIVSYNNELQFIFKFIDIKSYIMLCTITFLSLLFQKYDFLPEVFIAIVYLGFGSALFYNGIILGLNYLKQVKKSKIK